MSHEVIEREREREILAELGDHIAPYNKQANLYLNIVGYLFVQLYMLFLFSFVDFLFLNHQFGLNRIGIPPGSEK